MKKTVFVFLAPGFEEIEAIGIIDTLRRADMQTITVAIGSSKNVIGAHYVEIVADKTFDETNFSTGDMLVLPGGMPGTNNLNAHNGLKKLLREYAAQGKYIAAICAAPLILGQMGLLQGESAICYPGYEDQLKGAIVKEDSLVVVSHKIITSKGPGTAIQFALTLIEILANSEFADKLAKAMITTR